MIVENLVIDRKPSYDDDYPNMLVGIVQMKGENGKMEVKLSNSVVSKIFALIRQDCQRVADENAAQTTHAIEQAEHEMPLLEASKEVI